MSKQIEWTCKNYSITPPDDDQKTTLFKRNNESRNVTESKGELTFTESKRELTFTEVDVKLTFINVSKCFGNRSQDLTESRHAFNLLKEE